MVDAVVEVADRAGARRGVPKMRTLLGRVARSCLYIRTTSAAALVTNRSRSGMPRISARHSVK
jgi:hypothetical protein